MISSRLTFLALNNTLVNNSEAKEAVSSVFAKMPEVSNFLETAVKVTSDGIVAGLVFYIDSPDCRRIINNARKINTLGVGKVASVAINGYQNNTVCFFTTVPGTMREVAKKWQQANYDRADFIPCGMYPIAENQTYLFGNFDYRKCENISPEQQKAAADEWKKQVLGICEKMESLHTPHFAETGLIIF